MTLEKWYKKAGKILDGMLAADDAYFTNSDENAYFCDKAGTHCYILENKNVLSVKNDLNKPVLKMFFENAIDRVEKAAEKKTIGRLDRFPYKVAKLENDDCTVFVQNRFINKFPKNAVFYLSSKYGPVVVGLWDNKKINIIAFVLPMLAPREFTPDVSEN